MNTAKAAITTAVRGTVQRQVTRSRYGMLRGDLENPKITPWNVKSDYPYYHRYVIGPPRNYISKKEKIFWGLFMTLVTYSVPAWIVYHWREYGQSSDGDEE